VDSTSLQNALKHLDNAFKRFFKKQNDRPQFKSKKNPVQSYTSQCNYPKKGKPTIEVDGNKIKLPKQAIGVDLGLKDFAILSDGTKVNAPKYFRKYEKELARWQRILSRRQKGGSNWSKARLKVARIHEKIVNARHDFLHKLSS
jgi:putative transposase